MQICPSCGEENPARFRLCGFCGTPLAAGRAGPGDPQDRHDRLLGSEGLDRPRRAARLRVAARAHDPLLRHDAGRARAPRRHDREVHRRRDHGRLRAADASTRTTRSGPSAPRPGCSARSPRSTTSSTGSGASASPTGPGSTPARSSPAIRPAASGSSPATRSTPRHASSRRRPTNEILIGELTYRLVRDAVEVEPVEPLELKGKAERVRGLPAARRSARSPRTGRARPHADGRSRAGDGPAPRDVRRRRPRPRRSGMVTVIGDAGRRQVPTDPRVPGLDRRTTRYIVQGRCLAVRPGASRSGRSWRSSGGAAEIDEDDPPDRARAKLLGLARRRRRSPTGSPSATGLSTTAVPAGRAVLGCPTDGRDPRRAGTARPRHRRHPLGGADPARPARAPRPTATSPCPVMILCTTRHDLLEERPTWADGDGRTDRPRAARRRRRRRHRRGAARPDRGSRRRSSTA